MAKFYGDFGKAAKDCLGAPSFDHKLSFSTKIPVPATLSGSITLKGGNPSGQVSSVYSIDKKTSAEVTVTEKGKVTTKVDMGGLHPGLKVTGSGSPTDLKSIKVATQYLQDFVGVKADLSGFTSTPKVDGSICANLKTAGMGVDAGVGLEYSLDAAKGLSKYNIGAQMKEGDLTVSLILADKFDTVKFGVANAFSKHCSAAAEVVYKLAKGDATISLGTAGKVNGYTVKMAVTSALVATASVSGSVMPNVSGTAGLQVDSALKTKFGLQLSCKY